MLTSWYPNPHLHFSINLNKKQKREKCIKWLPSSGASVFWCLQIERLTLAWGRKTWLPECKIIGRSAGWPFWYLRFAPEMRAFDKWIWGLPGSHALKRFYFNNSPNRELPDACANEISIITKTHCHALCQSLVDIYYSSLFDWENTSCHKVWFGALSFSICL